MFTSETDMSSEDITPDLDRVQDLYSKGEIEDAEILLQKCIDKARLPSHAFMEQIMRDSNDESIKDSVLKLHFLNYV